MAVKFFISFLDKLVRCCILLIRHMPQLRFVVELGVGVHLAWLALECIQVCDSGNR